MDNATASNAANPLTIPTYDGSGQVVHPDVVDAGAGGWNGYRYWMAFTPYPGSDNDYENPSIVASNDKTTWVVPAGLTNPVEPKPDGDVYNNDPDLVLVDGTMYLFFQQSLTADDTEIYYRTSTDGITWADKVQIETPILPEEIASPAFVKEPDGWSMFYSDGSAVCYTSAPALSGPWADPFPVTIDGVGASHVDVIKADGVYYGVFLQSDYTLKLGVSWVNAAGWYIRSTDILTKSASGGWDDWGFYRSTIQKTATGLDLWYTGKGGESDWRFGYTAIAMA